MNQIDTPKVWCIYDGMLDNPTEAPLKVELQFFDLPKREFEIPAKHGMRIPAQVKADYHWWFPNEWKIFAEPGIILILAGEDGAGKPQQFRFKAN